MSDWLSAADWAAWWLSVKLALISTLLLLGFGIPLAWWLAHGRSRWRLLVDILVALPLVLPPTVLGFYLLLLLSPQHEFGLWLNTMGLQPFSFSGLIVGSLIYSLPFVIQPLRSSFSAIRQQDLEIASTLGAGPLARWYSVILPQARPGLLAALVLGMAHTMGEFGVVMMIGGNIPEQTQVVSIMLYEHVEALQYDRAHRLAALLLISSVVLLVPVYLQQHRHSPL